MIKPEIIILNSNQEQAYFLKGEKLVNTIFFSQKKTNSFLERKVFNAFLKIGLEAERKNECVFYVNFSTLRKIVRFNSNSSSELKGAIERINEFRFKIREDENSEHIQPMRVALADHGVNLTLHQKIYELQDSSERFIKLDMSCYSKLNSFYACGLYEIILLDEKKGGTSQMLIQDFIELLQVNKKYLDSFKLFNSKIIKPAINKINSYTDYEVVLQKNRGRRVSAIAFKIILKLGYMKYKNVDLTIAESRLFEIGINQEVIDSLLEKYSVMHILGNIDYVLMINKRLKVENLQGYVIVAIKKNYGQIVDVIKDKRDKIKSNKIESKTDTHLLLNAEIKKCVEIVENKIDTEKQKLLSTFEIFLDEYLPFLKQSYVKHQFNSKAICIAFALFHKQDLAN